MVSSAGRAVVAAACVAGAVSSASGFVVSASRGALAQQRRFPGAAAPRAAAGRALHMHQVTIEHEGETHVLQVEEYTSILEAALDAGITLPHDCKLGVCLTCPSKIVSGEVDQEMGTLEDSVTSLGYALTCCAFPRSDVVVRSIPEDELVSAQFEKF